MTTMTADEIMSLLREYQEGYAAQDNVDAAKAARILQMIIDHIEGKPEENARYLRAEMRSPDIEELRRKFLGVPK